MAADFRSKTNRSSVGSRSRWARRGSGRRHVRPGCEGSRAGDRKASSEEDNLNACKRRQFDDVSKKQKRGGRGPTEMVSHDGDESTEQTPDQDVRRVMTVIHCSTDGNEGGADKWDDGNPGFDLREAG
jgi:hypothetical protein